MPRAYPRVLPLLLGVVLGVSLLPAPVSAEFTCTCNCVFEDASGAERPPVEAGRLTDPSSEANVDNACLERCNIAAAALAGEPGGPFTYYNHSLSACEGTGEERPATDGGTNTNAPAGAGPAPTLPNPLGGSTDVRTIIGRVINAALGISGSLALLMFIWGGVQWLTSGGSPEKIQKGKSTIVWAVLGLVLIFGSYAILNFVLGAILGA